MSCDHRQHNVLVLGLNRQFSAGDTACKVNNSDSKGRYSEQVYLWSSKKHVKVLRTYLAPLKGSRALHIHQSTKSSLTRVQTKCEHASACVSVCVIEFVRLCV